MLSYTNYKREKNIRKVLKSLTKQRISMILPNNIWVIENVSKLPFKEEALKTCLIRGWVEIIEEAVPSGDLSLDHHIKSQQTFSHHEPIYRITDAGWAIVNRTHSWIIGTFFISLLAVTASLIQLHQ